MAKLISAILFLMLLSGCYTTTVVEYREVPVTIPEDLILRPCKPVGPGGTVESLATAYTKNTTCIGKYEAMRKSVENYNNVLNNSNNNREDSKLGEDYGR